MSDNQQFWFAARTRKNQELSIRDRLIKLGITHYLPTRQIVKQLKYRKKRVEVPAIQNLVFIHATKEIAYSLPNEYGLKLFYIQDLATHSILTVPDKQMCDFMHIMDLSPDAICLEENSLEIGCEVEIIKGEFSGIKGELISIANRSYVIVRILHILSLQIQVPKSYLKITDKKTPSIQPNKGKRNVDS